MPPTDRLLQRRRRNADTRSAVIYFFRQGGQARSCETRLNPDAPGYQLLITEEGVTRTEAFDELADMLAREHELVQAWRATGWREVGAPAGRSTGEDR